MAQQIPGATIQNVDRMVTLPGGGTVQIRSADDPDSLRGDGLNFVVIDEAAYIKPAAWTEALRPALSDRKGGAMLISTPRGRNHFWELYQRGLDEQETEWASFQFPTVSNPFIDPLEIEEAKRTLPELIYMQEYLAEFIDDQGGVFRRVQSAVMDGIDEPEQGRQYVAGVDVAASIDYTVVSVFDVEAKRQVHMDRFNRVDYPVLESRLAALYERWNLTNMVVEANSIGRPVIDHLIERGLTIQAFTTTNATKQAIIQNLQSAFEHEDIKIIDDPILIGELLSFEGSRTPSGAYRYSAPDGMHDDCVMSLAIGWDGIDRQAVITANPFYN